EVSKPINSPVTVETGSRTVPALGLPAPVLGAPPPPPAGTLIPICRVMLTLKLGLPGLAGQEWIHVRVSTVTPSRIGVTVKVAEGPVKLIRPGLIFTTLTGELVILPL